jgi:hypothetical protein
MNVESKTAIRARCRTISALVISGAAAFLVRCSSDLNVGELFPRHDAAGPGGASPDVVTIPPVDASAGAAGAGGNIFVDVMVRDDLATESAPPPESGIDVASPDVARDVGVSADATIDVSPRDAIVDARPCSLAAAACARGDDCCSGFCIGNVCMAPAVCRPAQAACTVSGSCCSGRCDPGPSALVCRVSCSADGLPCASPQDCCSLACTNGTCGGTMCSTRRQSCTSPLDCCSLVCDATNLCQRSTDDGGLCRRAGEDCEATEVNECCFGCDTTIGRCKSDPTLCHGLGAGCTTDADCCKGVCRANAQQKLVCQIPCLADGQACTMGAECCGFACTGTLARCGTPGRSCGATGTSCQNDSQCCSQFCSGGFCDLLCQLTGVRCRIGSDCCSGVCTAGLCAK